MIRQIKQVEADIPVGVHRTAEAARDLVDNRLLLKGLNADGVKMITASARKLDHYSLRHGKKRVKAGLPVDRITLHFTGDMMRSFKVLTQSPTARTVEVGFDDDSANQIAEYNEERFGNAFSLSPIEREACGDYYVRTFNGFFK